MKKNLMLISFAFIFLLTLSNVTGLKELGENCASNDECASGNCINFCVTPGPTIASSGDSSTSTRTSASASSVRSSVPRGFTAVAAADPKVGTCYVKSSQSKRSLFKGRFLGKLFE